MANKRNLKKDIDYLVYEVVSDSYTYKYLFPDNDHKEADKIIEEAVNLRNELFARVNNPDGKDNKKLVKEHYKKINKDLLTSIDNYFQRLNGLLSGDKQPKKETKEVKEVKEVKASEAPNEKKEVKEDKE